MKKKYSVKKTIIKGLEIFLMGGISYLITYLTNLPDKPEIVLLILAILKMVQNYLKNRKK